MPPNVRDEINEGRPYRRDGEILTTVLIAGRRLNLGRRAIYRLSLSSVEKYFLLSEK